MAGFDPITAALDVGGKLIDKFWPDAGQAEKDKMQLLLTTFSAQAGIVQAEVASSNWLAASWRPVTMLIFVALICARWFGWAAPNLQPDEYIELWSIVKIGLSGYVIGRSVEKVAPSIADAIKR